MSAFIVSPVSRPSHLRSTRTTLSTATCAATNSPSSPPSSSLSSKTQSTFPLQILTDNRQQQQQHHHEHIHSTTSAPITTTRRKFLTLIVTTLMASSTLSTPPFKPALAAKPPAQTLEKAGASIVMCRRLMGPVSGFIDAGAWDKGRTNVNYCTRVLGMRRNMRQAADLLPEGGDGYYDALDIMGDMENVMSQLDASLYTPLFIPADEGDITPEQQIYQRQAKAFYDQAIQGFERFLALLPGESLAKAVDIANNTKYEIDIEKDSSYSNL